MAEAEYVAVAAAVQTVTAMQNMMVQTNIWDETKTAIKTDNMATVEVIQKPHGTKRRKFIDLRHQYIAQQLIAGRMNIAHVTAAQ